MQAVTRKLYSEEEYWALEETSPIKHEYWDGEIVAMAGGTFNHAELAANVIAAARQKLRGKPCRAVGSDMRVKVAKSTKRFNTYPDALIVCPPLQFETRASGVQDTLLNPRVLVEVLSPSTAEFDQNEKFDQYKLIESLSDYILIWQDRVRVKHYHRAAEDAWIEKTYILRSESFALSALELSFALEEIYEGLDIPEAPLLAPLPDDEDDQ